MKNITDKMLGCVAKTAEELFLESLGLASCGCAYEPKLSEKTQNFKAKHKSKIEMIYDKIIG